MPFYFLLIYRKWLIFAIYAKSFWVFREKLHPSQGLKEALAGTGLEVRSIGDAASVKNGFSNVQEAFAAAWDI